MVNIIFTDATPARVSQSELQTGPIPAELKLAASLWQSHAYYQAAEIISAVASPGSSDRIARQRFIDLSRAFVAWDRFDHTRALEILRQHESVALRYFPTHLDVLQTLAGEARSDNRSRMPWLLMDLRNNAWRRAGQGAFDDAFARVYRLIEWSAQWIIASTLGWQTDNLPRDQIPQDILLSRNSLTGQWQSGLVSAWKVATLSGIREVSDFVDQELVELMAYMRIRNYSILAHGDQPVQKAQWASLAIWLESRFMPLLMQLVQINKLAVAIKPDNFQLPVAYPEALFE
jgi:CRISPR-associated protein (TIGR02710 family)